MKLHDEPSTMMKKTSSSAPASVNSSATHDQTDAPVEKLDSFAPSENRLEQSASRPLPEPMDGSDWVWLLQVQPQFADSCPWEELTERDWVQLLRKRPQFIDRLQRFAEQGDATAQSKLAVCFHEVGTLEKGDAEAVKWFRKAAEQGHALSQYNLGLCYDNGQGVEQSDVEAVKWYRKAAEQGHADAQYRLGLAYFAKNSRQDAVRWWRKAAAQNSAFAQCDLGVSLLLGIGGDKNETEAIVWLHRAAKQHHEIAYGWLSYCFSSGIGTSKDENESEFWLSMISYKKASVFGVMALFLLEVGRAPDALPYAERAVDAIRIYGEVFPATQRIAMLDGLAEALEEAQEGTEIIKAVCSEILSLCPEDDDSTAREVALVRLGRACQRLGDKAGAADAWSKALAIVEKHGGKHAQYGMSAEDIRAALNELKRVQPSQDGFSGGAHGGRALPGRSPATAPQVPF